MKYQLPEQVKNILSIFKKNDFQTFIVGGAVRNLLLGKAVSDWDFTTDAEPGEILKLFPQGFYDNKFGTVGIPIKDKVYEITTMRKEGGYKDFRHPDKILWTNKLQEDLARRDFTINAVALFYHPELNLGSINIIDPFHGQDDIKNKLIRAVGDPNKRFQEDALRLIRAIRFATQLNFEIDPQTFQAIKDNGHLIRKIAGERVRDELFKILESKNCYEGIAKLKESGILQIILPELEKCFGIVQQGPKHDRVYDIGEHSLLTLKTCPSKDPLVRLAALLHDVGKAKTVNTQNGNVTFYNHDMEGGKISLQIAKRFNLSKKQRDKLYRLIRWHLFTVSEYQTDAAIRRFIKNVGADNIDDMIDLRIGDRLGGGTLTPTSWRMEKFKERIKQVLQKPFNISDLKVNGNDVMRQLNIKAGPKVGEVLQKLFDEVLEDAAKNNREYLLDRINDYS